MASRQALPIRQQNLSEVACCIWDLTPEALPNTEPLTLVSGRRSPAGMLRDGGWMPPGVLGQVGILTGEGINQTDIFVIGSSKKPDCAAGLILCRFRHTRVYVTMTMGKGWTDKIKPSADAQAADLRGNVKAAPAERPVL